MASASIGRRPLTKAKRRVSDAEEYLRDIELGRETACNRMKQLAGMMLPRFEGGYKRWHFDIDKAERPIRFIERFCKLPSGRLGVPFALERYEKAIIELAFGFVDDEGYRQFQEMLVVVGRKNGKALALDTEIPTPDGWRTMRDVHMGDTVFGADGKPARVIGESRIFHKRMYRVTFEDGAEVKASADHLWTVATKNSRRGKGSDWIVLSTEDMAGDYRRVRKDGKGIECKYRVPMAKAVEYPEADLPIDPYVLGSWLGNGTSTKPELSVGEMDKEETVAIYAAHGVELNELRYKNNRGKAPLMRIGKFIETGTCGRHRSLFREELAELGLIGNKHIPEAYMLASIEQRMELLRGLMDTDGTCSKAGQCTFTQKRREICVSFVELCGSLGIKATMRCKDATCNGKPAGKAYEVQFWTDKTVPCFHLTRKRNRLKERLAPRMGAKSIRRIEEIPVEPSKCIAVDNSDHLYLFGRHYTATHNTSLGAAMELYMLVADGEGAPQIYNVATSKDQASLAYGAVLKMVRQSTELSKKLRKGTVSERDQDGIIFDANFGYITPLTNQTRHLDGLDVHFCLFDEMAASTNRDQYDLMKQAMSARKQPMITAISTNGFERGNLFDDQYDYACGILDGKIVDDRMLPMIYELDQRDEWIDEKCWKKANPGLGTVKSYEYMRDAVNKGMQDPSFLPTLLTKDFNVPETKASAWLSFEEAVNTEPLPFPMEENAQQPRGKGFRYGVAGFDASDTTDLSAGKVLMMRPDDPHIYELSMYWLPEDALNKGSGYRRERDDVPYRQWEERGLLRTVPGNTVPKRVFVEWLEEIKQNYDVFTYAIGYDPWHILGSDEEQLTQYVGKSLCEPVRQGPKTLSMPGKQFRAQLESGLVVDGHNPINEWCRMNVSVKTDSNANISFVKNEGKAVNRIDGFMAELCAYVALLRHEDEYKGAI